MRWGLVRDDKTSKRNWTTEREGGKGNERGYEVDDGRPFFFSPPLPPPPSHLIEQRRRWQLYSTITDDATRRNAA
jgi:hypothetical protein